MYAIAFRHLHFIVLRLVAEVGIRPTDKDVTDSFKFLEGHMDMNHLIAWSKLLLMAMITTQVFNKSRIFGNLAIVDRMYRSHHYSHPEPV